MFRRHLNIQKEYIGFQLFNHFHDLVAVISFAYYLEIRFLLQNTDDSLTGKSLVICYNDAGLHIVNPKVQDNEKTVRDLCEYI